MRSSTLVRSLTVVAVLASSLVMTQAGPANAAPQDVASGSQAQADERCGVINFEKASVVLSSDPKDAPRRILVVTGEAPTPPISVTLEPLTYVQRPDYWGIEVVGCFPFIGTPVVKPFTAKLDITSTTGKLGVEVIGATTSQKIQIFR